MCFAVFVFSRLCEAVVHLDPAPLYVLLLRCCRFCCYHTPRAHALKPSTLLQDSPNDTRDKFWLDRISQTYKRVSSCWSSTSLLYPPGKQADKQAIWPLRSASSSSLVSPSQQNRRYKAKLFKSPPVDAIDRSDYLDAGLRERVLSRAGR